MDNIFILSRNLLVCLRPFRFLSLYFLIAGSILFYIYGAGITIRVFNILTMDMLFFIPFLWYDLFNKSMETRKLSAL